MRKSKLSLQLVLALLLVTAMVSGCSKSATISKDDANATETKVPNGTTADNKPVEITFWRTDYDPEVKALKGLIESFHKEHPNITVKMELFPNAQYETKIRTALAGAGAPDIMALDAPTLASYASQKAIVPLDGYLKADGNISDISAPVIQSLTYNGQIYAAPLNDAVVAMFYNKKLFAKAGITPPSKNPDEAWTIDQYIAAAEKINDPAKKIVGIDPAWGFGTGEGSAYVKMPLLWQAGGDILSPDGSTSKGYLDSPIMKKVLQRFSSLYNDKKIAVKELPADAFFNGTLAIKVDGPWSISYNHDKFPNFKLGEDWDVAPYWKAEKQIVANGSWNLAITKDSKHANEAWMFINWVTGIEGAKTWYKATANIPARNSTAESFPELQSYPLNIFLAESAKYAKPRPVSPAYPAISLAYTKMFEDVGIANRNIDDAMKDAVDQIEKALAKTKK